MRVLAVPRESVSAALLAGVAGAGSTGVACALGSAAVTDSDVAESSGPSDPAEPPVPADGASVAAWAVPVLRGEVVKRATARKRPARARRGLQ